MRFPRLSGVVLHPTCLPGPFGIGDLGDAALRFVDFLNRAGQSYWQVLPLSPTGYGDSPYQGLSALAGNPILISPERLVALGHLSQADISNIPTLLNDGVDFGSVLPFKLTLLNRAFANFRTSAPAIQRAAFEQFCSESSDWLDDWALFAALKESHQLAPWNAWEQELVTRRRPALKSARRTLADQIENQKYRQWQFYDQWLAVKRYANEHGVRIIGDIPLYVANDSCDVWANTSLFHFDKHLQPKVVSGVPPDYFSATGQLWGHPIYRWDAMKRDAYAWWISRFRMAFTQADIVRIDHFRGFYNYWEVPAGEKTAVKGKWRFGPGSELFRSVTAALGEVAIIAEDLGDFDPKSRAGVDELRAEFGYPGMKVLQFAFGNSATDPFLPHNYRHDFVAYTGTHDNDTTVGWYQSSSTEKERDYARRYLARDGSDIAWDLIRLGWGSVADTAMTTVQDLLSLGHTARMNTPSTSGAPNWCWRLLPGQFDDGVAARLAEMTRIYGRIQNGKSGDQHQADRD